MASHLPCSNQLTRRVDETPADAICRLVRGHHRVDRNVGAAVSFRVEFHRSVNEREDRVILAEAYIDATAPFGAALAYEDVAGEDGLSGEALHAEALSGRIAFVAPRAT